jgi:hypothetical protein
MCCSAGEKARLCPAPISPIADKPVPSLRAGGEQAAEAALAMENHSWEHEVRVKTEEDFQKPRTLN